MSEHTKAAITEQARKAANLVPVNVTPEDTTRIADAVSAVWEPLYEALDQRVHDQTHARLHAELAIEDAIKEIEKGCEWDAVAILRRALENGRIDTADTDDAPSVPDQNIEGDE